jgi:hypothetical protein
VSTVQPWYPEQLKVRAEGTPATYEFMATVFGPQAHLHYAEFGIYRGETAWQVAQRFPNATLHLFDFHDTLDAARERLAGLPNRIHWYGNTQRYNDSYNWSLLQLIKAQQGRPLFDYCFLDGAHTVAVDALNFFLADRLLRVGGHMDFDDYTWRLRGSSLDPQKVPAIAMQYTDEQIDAQQVRLIVDELVRRDPRYCEVLKDKVFRKTAA